jgi:hypothetical protein
VTTATITDPVRRAEFEEVFGTATVPVKGWLPFRASLPIGVREVYELDVDALEPEIRSRLVRHLAAKFGVDVAEADAVLAAEGLPILADSCVVSHDRPDFL